MLLDDELLLMNVIFVGHHCMLRLTGTQSHIRILFLDHVGGHGGPVPAIREFGTTSPRSLHVTAELTVRLSSSISLQMGMIQTMTNH